MRRSFFPLIAARSFRCGEKNRRAHACADLSFFSNALSKKNATQPALYLPPWGKAEQLIVLRFSAAAIIVYIFIKKKIVQ